MSEKYFFELYLSGKTPSNKKIVKELKSILDDKFEDQYSLEVIFVTKKPELADNKNVISTPTLMKLSPPPARIFAGNLNDRKKLLLAVNETVKEIK